MADLLTVLATVEGGESSKVLFYVGGGLLALWAVALGVVGLQRPAFPSGEGGARAVMGVSALLVVVACASAVITG